MLFYIRIKQKFLESLWNDIKKKKKIKTEISACDCEICVTTNEAVRVPIQIIFKTYTGSLRSNRNLYRKKKIFYSTVIKNNCLSSRILLEFETR